MVWKAEMKNVGLPGSTHPGRVCFEASDGRQRVSINGSESTGPHTVERLPPFRQAVWKYGFTLAKVEVKLDRVLHSPDISAFSALIMLPN
jgi:hypothetical protein